MAAVWLRATVRAMQRTLITGATTPVGEEIARRFAEVGEALFLVGDDLGALEDLDYRLCQSELHRYVALVAPEAEDCQEVCAGAARKRRWSGLVLVQPDTQTLLRWLEAFGRVAGGTAEHPARAVIVTDAPTNLASPERQLAQRWHVSLNAVWAPAEVFGPNVPSPAMVTASEVAETARTLVGPIARTLTGQCLKLGPPQQV